MRGDINRIDFEKMTPVQQFKMAEGDLRRIISSLEKSGKLRIQDSDDILQSLTFMFLSGEMSRMKLKNETKLSYYVYSLATSYALDLQRV